MKLAGDVLGQLSGGAAFTGDGVEVRAVGEDDGVAIGRNCRIAEPFCRLSLEEGGCGEK
ncbi:hypothetical protein N9F58_00920 [Akkermansiaceae bacterium]|nr:hypothetical protein [Akkermansiaceae bacterium]